MGRIVGRGMGRRVENTTVERINCAARLGLLRCAQFGRRHNKFINNYRLAALNGCQRVGLGCRPAPK
jgi:hypothetical protein